MKLTGLMLVGCEAAIDEYEQKSCKEEL